MWVTELPPIERPKERVERVTIPGRPGDVTLREADEDEPVYEAYDRQMILTVPNEDDYKYLLNWLRGSGPVVFSNEPDREYTAEIVSVQFLPLGNTLRRGTVTFHVQPYKAQTPREAVISVDDTKTVTNPGDVKSKPLITLTGTGEASITVGLYTMTFDDLPGELVIDCDAEVITTEDEWDGQWTGKYIRIPKGEVEITVDGCTAEILPRWRWV